MASIFNARKVLHLSQQQLADYLSVPRTQVALAETGARQLSNNASQKAGFLAIALLQPNLPESEALLQQENERQNQQAITALQKHIEDCKYQLMVLTKKQAGLQLLRQQATDCLYGVAKIKTIPPLPGREGTKDKKWIELLQTGALLQLNKASTAKLALLTLKIKGLQGEIKEAETMIGTMETEIID